MKSSFNTDNVEFLKQLPCFVRVGGISEKRKIAAGGGESLKKIEFWSSKNILIKFIK